MYDIDFSKVFHSNHMPISHRQEDIGDFHIRDLEMTLQGCSKSNFIADFESPILSSHKCFSVNICLSHNVYPPFTIVGDN